MAKNGSQRQEDISELLSRLDWLDEERRKVGRRLAELEQGLNKQGQAIKNRDQRILELEAQLSKANLQLAKLSNFDIELEQFKDEIILLIEQYDQRRITTQDELEKLRRVEHEVHLRDLATIRKNLTPISRLEEEMTLRQAEEARLAKLIGGLQAKITNLQNETETWSQELRFIDDLVKTNKNSTDEISSSHLAISKKIDNAAARIEVISHGLTKIQSSNADLAENVYELKKRIQNWTEQVQVGEYERNQRLKKWEERWEAAEEKLDRFSSDWVDFTEQYNEAKMAVSHLTEWRQEVEMRQKESQEKVRVETIRMQAILDNYKTENEKARKNFEVEIDQGWSNAARREAELSNQIEGILNDLKTLIQEKDRLWRVQAAQSEALKKLPLTWLEEVEKAMDHDPDSRRSPALIPVREE
ncbi:MAG: hypothetical protein BMS9Abin02_1373 [Anaerolineae bacterium]|nr:MAG: hypothetical protein BMS9Abin02_1373 [Anaerolineae bacterium]